MTSMTSKITVSSDSDIDERLVCVVTVMSVIGKCE